jgi:hypothetical protein
VLFAFIGLADVIDLLQAVEVHAAKLVSGQGPLAQAPVPFGSIVYRREPELDRVSGTT